MCGNGDACSRVAGGVEQGGMAVQHLDHDDESIISICQCITQHSKRCGPSCMVHSNLRSGGWFHIATVAALSSTSGLVVQWLGRRTCDQQAASSTPGRALPG